jgi:riboflavin synthase
MFTGIIEGLGTITAVRSAGLGKRLTIDAGFMLDQTKVGDSISVSGACLTAVEIAGRRFAVDVSPETLQKTTFGNAKVGDRVNLERAMHLSDRIDGHLVSGHIDGIGIIGRRERVDPWIMVTIAVPATFTQYMIVKGSVAVDGISLTINSYDANGFCVSIIPHTTEFTTIGFKHKGDAVNIETDMIGKYVERFLGGISHGNKGEVSDQKGIDKEFLLKTGFID